MRLFNDYSGLTENKTSLLTQWGYHRPIDNYNGPSFKTLFKKIAWHSWFLNISGQMGSQAKPHLTSHFSLSLICHIKVSQISPTQPYHSGCPQKTRAYYPLMEVITKIHIILFPENKFSAINVCNVTKLFKLFTKKYIYMWHRTTEHIGKIWCQIFTLWQIHLYHEIFWVKTLSNQIHYRTHIHKHLVLFLVQVNVLISFVSFIL